MHLLEKCNIAKKNDTSYEEGYTLSCIIGHLESLIDAEGLEISWSPKKAKNKTNIRKQDRLRLVEEAVAKLNEAAGMGGDG